MNNETRKLVNITPTSAITSTNPPIRGKVRGVRMRIVDIRKCIMARAKVEEVLPDGEVITLTLANYNKDNIAAVKAQDIIDDDAEELEVYSGTVTPGETVVLQLGDNGNVTSTNVEPEAETSEEAAADDAIDDKDVDGTLIIGDGDSLKLEAEVIGEE